MQNDCEFARDRDLGLAEPVLDIKLIRDAHDFVDADGKPKKLADDGEEQRKAADIEL
jgi:hypothetical protein